MRYTILIALAVLVARSASAADDLTLEEWLDLYVSSCVGGGSTSTASGSLDAGIGLSLKKLGPHGDVTGKLQVTKSEYRLLTDGINNAMSKVAADQADKVRECLAPFRANLARAMNQQMTGSPSGGQPTVFLLNPHEEKVIKALAGNRGLRGEIGKEVPKAQILRETGLSDIRFRPTIRNLQSMLLATESQFPNLVEVPGGLPKMEWVDVVSLWDKGEEYALEMGYAQ